MLVLGLLGHTHRPMAFSRQDVVLADSTRDVQLRDDEQVPVRSCDFPGGGERDKLQWTDGLPPRKALRDGAARRRPENGTAKEGPVP